MGVKTRLSPVDEVDKLLRRLAANRAEARRDGHTVAAEVISEQIDTLLSHRFELKAEA